MSQVYPGFFVVGYLAAVAGSCSAAPCGVLELARLSPLVPG